MFAFGGRNPGLRAPGGRAGGGRRRPSMSWSISRPAVTRAFRRRRELACDAPSACAGWRPKPEERGERGSQARGFFDPAAGALRAGDEVVIPKPFWVSYPEQACIGATPVLVDTREKTAGASRPPRSRRCSPHAPRPSFSARRPTRRGRLHRGRHALIDVLRKHTCWLITRSTPSRVHEGSLNSGRKDRVGPSREDDRRRRRLWRRSR